MAIQRSVTGRVSIEYDEDAAVSQRVLTSGVLVGGRSLSAEFQGVTRFRPGGMARARPLMFELYDAIHSVERTTPRERLVARDAADRIHELTANPQIENLRTGGLSNLAVEECLEALRICSEWEAGGPDRYIHKGGPYFFGGIAAFGCRNVDVGMMLLESGDLADSETFRRAGVPDTGLDFPGRSFLRFKPDKGSALNQDILAMRQKLSAWLAEFESSSGKPSGDPLTIQDLDDLVFPDLTLTTEIRYVLGYLIRKVIVESDPTLAAVKGKGPLSRRQQAEWALGLLTATEGIVRRVEGTLPPTAHYIDVESQVAHRHVKPGTLTPNQLKGGLGNVLGAHSVETVKDCLVFWQSAFPTAELIGFPWFVRWVDTARFVRNQTAHILSTPPELDSDWMEVERVARFALLSSIWLLRDEARKKPPSAAAGVPPPPPT